MATDPSDGNLVQAVENGESAETIVDGKVLVNTFADLAEAFRPIAADLEDSWIRSERIKKFAIEELADLALAASLDDESAPAINREDRRDGKKHLDERAIQIGVESMALVLRYGIYEHYAARHDGAAKPDPHRFRGFGQVSKLISAPLEAKKEALTDEDEQERFDSELSRVATDAAQDLLGVYDHIYRLSPKLLRATAEYVRLSVGKAKSFIGWLEQVDQEQDGDFRAMLELLAHDLLEKNDASNTLRAAIQHLESEANDLFVRPFSEHALKGNVDIVNPATKKTLEFISKLSGVGEKTEAEQDEFYDRFAEMRSEWPPEFEIEYKAFNRGITQEFDARMKTVLSKYVNRSRQTPTRVHLDRVLAEVLPERTGSTARRRGAKGGRVTGGARAQTALKDALGIRPEAEPEKATKAVLKQKQETSLVETEGSEDEINRMIARYCKANPEPELERSLKDLVEHIMTAPFGTGTKTLVGKFARVEGKKYDLRRATVRHNDQVESSGSVAFRTRIIYTVVTNNGDAPIVAVKEVLHHNVMDRKYNSKG